jgi:hypothetical protein
MITIEQNPQGFMGSNTDHIFTLSSNNSSLPNFTYVVDVWFNPYETGSVKIGRVKVRPNTFGKAIFNARDIIRNYIKPNPRVSGETYLEISGGEWLNENTNENGNMSILSGFSESNVFNGVEPYETLNHTGSYRIIAGEEYLSGTTKVLIISTDYYVPTETIDVNYSLDTIGLPYLGEPNQILWSGMNSWDEFGTSVDILSSGYTYQHYTSGGTEVAAGSSINDSGSYFKAGDFPPNDSDVFYVYSTATGCGFKFIWNCPTCVDDGWNYVSTYSPEGSICTGGSNLVRLSPAADVSYYQSVMGDAASPSSLWSNTDYMSKFYLSTSATTTGGQFLDDVSRTGNFYNKFGNDNSPYTTSGITLTSTDRFRHRQHHRECPIIVNFAVGNLGQLAYSSSILTNQVSNLVELRKTGNLPLTYHTSYEPSYIGTTENINTNPDYLITNFNKLYYGTAEFDTLSSVAFYTAQSGTSTNYDVNGNSLIYVFDLYGDDCLDGEAVHFLYLNTNGAWDTITFSQKNIKSLSTKRDVYAQDLLRSAPSYMWGSSQQRNITYNQNTLVSVQAQTTWMDENDVENYRDFFLSNYVYQIIQKIGEGDILYSTLIPVSITESTFEEYKSRYNKLYQYTMNYVYNPIKQFNTSI